MNSKAKFIPLLLILVLSVSPLTISPTTATTANNNAPTITSSNAPWIPDSSKYASYNGHFQSNQVNSTNPIGNPLDEIVVANLTVSSISSSYSNLSIVLRELFNGAVIPGVSGLWYEVDKSTGNVVDNSQHNSSQDGYPCFFYVPSITSLKIGDYVSLATPFYGKPVSFYVNKTETVLGIQTTELINSTSISWGTSSNGGSINFNANLWISNDSNGLLMRIQGSSISNSSYSGESSTNNMDVEMQVLNTNIMTLTLPPMPSTEAVPWMRVGRFIQFNLQGSGWVAPTFGNETANTVLKLPGDAEFGATVSANITLRVERATTGWVPPWESTRWLWVVHVMLNNTQLLLPDFWSTIYYLNSSLASPAKGSIPLADINAYLSDIGQFNKTGLVAEAYFLVDNATGITLSTGSVIPESPTPFNSSEIGTEMQQGYAFLVLQFLAQSYFNSSWSMPYNYNVNQPMTRMDANVTTGGTASINSLAKVAGTEYLKFPGGGGGNCWKVTDSVNVSEYVKEDYNLTSSPLAGSHNGIYYGPPEYSVENVSTSDSANGYVDIERFSGFPLAFDEKISGSYNGTVYTGLSSTLPQTFNWTLGFYLDLSALVPSSNIIWASFQTAHLSLGAGVNGTYGGLNEYGFMVTLNGETNTTVDITGSASLPPDTGALPNGTQSLVYLNIKGTLVPGTNVITLYVFVNRTKVLALGLDEYSLRLWYWNATVAAWEQLTDPHGHPASSYVYINATTGCIVGYLYHLSYFAVLGSPPTSGPSGAIPEEYILIAAVAVIVVLAVVVYVRRSRGRVK